FASSVEYAPAGPAGQAWASAPLVRAHLDRILDALQRDFSWLARRQRRLPGGLPGDGGDEDLVALGDGADPSRHVDTVTRVVTVGVGGLGGVQADANSRSEAVVAPLPVEETLDGYRAGDRIGGILEGHEEAVTGVLHLLAVMLNEGFTQIPVVPLQELCPGLIPQSSRHVGRPHDVGEHEGEADPVLAAAVVFAEELRHLALVDDGAEF